MMIGRAFLRFSAVRNRLEFKIKDIEFRKTTHVGGFYFIRVYTVTMNIETSVIFKKVIVAAFVIFIAIQGLIMYEIKNNTYEFIDTYYASTNISYASEVNDFCFFKDENRDITKITLRIDDKKVTGTMDWVPYEKDSGRGTLSGTLLPDGQMDLMFDYMIEGSHQTETKLMKISDDKLYIKHGELEDKKYNGNLTYKDREKAVYNEIIEPCSVEKKETTY